MIKEIIRDPIRLAVPSKTASPKDAPTADDLADTLKANADKCVGMAANMIGMNVRIIVFDDNGKYTEMFNPEILSFSEPYDAEEGCLSLDGTRKAKRYGKIKVKWQTRDMSVRIKTLIENSTEVDT